MVNIGPYTLDDSVTLFITDLVSFILLLVLALLTIMWVMDNA